jgi:antitoxin component HigA of HigAB toxin-antitoxin module
MMEINLIAKNKIADYIQRQPEAQTVFLNWLTDFPYREAKGIARHIERSSGGTFSRASSPLNRDEYHIEYCTNNILRTAYISCLGTQKQMEAYYRSEFEKEQPGDQDLVMEVRTTEVILTPPLSMGSSAAFSEKTVGNPNENTLIIDSNDKETAHAGSAYVESDRDYKTKFEYEQALNRAIAIFEAQPDTPEFEELNLLLPLVKRYEDTKLSLPKLDIADVIRLTIKNFNLLRPMLIPIIGSEEEVELFLTGKHQLQEETVELICNTIGIQWKLYR